LYSLTHTNTCKLRARLIQPVKGRTCPILARKKQNTKFVATWH